MCLARHIGQEISASLNIGRYLPTILTLLLESFVLNPLFISAMDKTKRASVSLLGGSYHFYFPSLAEAGQVFSLVYWCLPFYYFSPLSGVFVTRLYQMWHLKLESQMCETIIQMQLALNSQQHP